MIKKFFMIILIASIIIIYVYSNTVVNVDVYHMAKTTTEKNNISDEARFKIILDKYAELLNTAAAGTTFEFDDFSLKYSLINDGLCENSIDSFGYIFRDVAGDHANELIVNDGYTIVGVFTENNGSITNILPGWSRNVQQLCSDGTIYNISSGGASNAIHATYSFNANGDSIILKEAYIYDSSSAIGENFDPEDYWFYTTTEDLSSNNAKHVSYDMARKYIDEREASIVKLNYKSFKRYDYNSQF